MSLPLNWFLNPSETEENISYISQRGVAKESDLYYPYTKPALPFMDQIREFTMTVPITSAVSNVLQNISKLSNYVGNMIETIPNALNKTIDGVREASSAAANEVGENFEEVSETLGEIIQNDVAEAVEAVAAAPKSWPKVQTPYVKDGKLHRIGAGQTRRRHKSRSHSRRRSHKRSKTRRSKK